MSYADRLNTFNQASSAAADHIGKMKDTLTNPALQENPVEMGLNLAGQTIGTAEGLVRIRAGMKNDDVTRNVQKAFYNKLSDLGAGAGAGAAGTAAGAAGANAGAAGMNAGEAVNQARAAAGQSSGSFVADTGSTLSTNVANVQSGATTVAPKIDPNASDLDAVDGGITQGVSQFPRSATNASDEGNELNRNINQKINSGLSGDERGALNDRLGSSIGTFGDINQMPEGGPKTQAMSNFLAAKNNVANDALARKAAGLPNPDSYTSDGKPVQSSAAPAGTDNTGLSVGGSAKQDAANGAANTGPSASATVAKTAETDNGASLIPSKVQSVLGGSDQDLASRGASLGLKGNQMVPGSGGAPVLGLSTTDAPSSSAHSVSQAQQFAADTHSRAQGAASGVESSLEEEGGSFASGLSGGARSFMGAAGGMLGDVSALTGGGGFPGLSGASSGSANADGLQKVQGVVNDVNTAKDTLGIAKTATSGLSKALGTEETLDALAPDTGPLAPILETGSLLATLGTGIASAIEGDKPAPPPPPPPKQKLGISIGADLQTSASGNVGAF